MSEDHNADESAETDGSTNSINRRRFVKSLGVAGGAAAFGATTMTGHAAAKKSGMNVSHASNGSGAATTKDKQINPSDWVVDVDIDDNGQTGTVPTVAQPAATEIYVGPNKNAEVEESSIESRSVESKGVRTQNFAVSGSATLLTWTIPYAVPVIGGDDLSFNISASVGLTGVSASFDVCLNGQCISIAGVDVSLGRNTFEVSTKGDFYGVPFEVSVSVTLVASIGGIFHPDPELQVSATGQVCLGRDLCDKHPSGWENIACMLCASAGNSITLIG